MKQLASQFKPHVWLNVHSGMEALFMPYDHQPRIPGKEYMLQLLLWLAGWLKELCTAIRPDGTAETAAVSLHILSVRRLLPL